MGNGRPAGQPGPMIASGSFARRFPEGLTFGCRRHGLGAIDDFPALADVFSAGRARPSFVSKVASTPDAFLIDWIEDEYSHVVLVAGGYPDYEVLRCFQSFFRQLFMAMVRQRRLLRPRAGFARPGSRRFATGGARPGSRRFATGGARPGSRRFATGGVLDRLAPVRYGRCSTRLAPVRYGRCSTRLAPVRYGGCLTRLAPVRYGKTPRIS